jgi:hypothetical protein
LRVGRNSSGTVNRYFTVVGAVALAAAQTALAPAAPPAGVPVYHPVSRSMSAPGPRSGSQAPFKTPFELNLHPKSQQFDPQATWSPLRWPGWHPVPGSLLYQPMWYQLGCFPVNGLSDSPASWNSPGAGLTPPEDFRIGSLVDGQGNPFGSSPSDVAKMAPSAGGATGPSNLVTLQSTPCGAANYFSL